MGLHHCGAKGGSTYLKPIKLIGLGERNISKLISCKFPMHKTPNKNHLRLIWTCLCLEAMQLCPSAGTPQALGHSGSTLFIQSTLGGDKRSLWFWTAPRPGVYNILLGLRHCRGLTGTWLPRTLLTLESSFTLVSKNLPNKIKILSSSFPGLLYCEIQNSSLFPLWSFLHLTLSAHCYPTPTWASVCTPFNYLPPWIT